MRELVGPAVQLRVRQLLLLVLHRHRIRGLQHLGFEQLGQRLLSGVAHLLATPFLHQSPVLQGAHQRQVRQPLLGLEHRGLQQHPQVLQQPPHRLRIEEVAVVVDQRRDTGLHLFHQQRQVELRRALFRLHHLEREVPQSHVDFRRVLQRQRHLEQRAAARIAPRLELLHQLLEGHVLVPVGAQRHFPHLGEQLAEGGGPVQPGPQHQRVDEEADESLRLGVRATRGGRAHAHVLLPRVPSEHRLEGRQQHHERCHPFAPTECLHVTPQRLRPQHVQVRTAEGLHHRTRPVRRQLQRTGRPGELPAPVRQLRLQHLALQPLALPHRVVRVLHGQLRQRCRVALGNRLVQRRHLAHEDAHGPAVGDDVVHHEHQHMLLLRQLQQRRPEQWAILQVEGPPHLCLDPRLHRRLTAVLRHPVQVHDLQRHVDVASDDLDGDAPFRVERRAQGLVPVHQRPEARLQRGLVQGARQPHGRPQVVRRVRRVQQRQEPQPLLRERQRHGALPGPPLQRRWRSPRDGHRPRQPLRQGRHRRGLEDLTHRQVDAEGLTNPRGEPHRQQRVTARFEEVVVPAHGREPQRVAPEAGEQLLHRRERRGMCVPLQLSHRRGQRLAVHLAIGQQRHPRQHHHPRHQERGQPPLQLRSEPASLQRLPLPGHHVRHQLLVAWRVLADHHQRLTHVRKREQRRLHLGRLDAMAANLDLHVLAAEVLQRAVPQPPRLVARAVEARSFPEGVGHEAHRRQLRPLPVAARQRDTADVQLAGDAHRHRAQSRIQHVHPRVGDGPADGHEGTPVLADTRPRRHVHRGLRGAVEVVQLRPQGRMAAVSQVWRQRLTAGEDPPQAGAGLREPWRIQEEPEHGRHEVQRGDALPGDDVGQIARLAVPTRLRHHQPRARQQRPEELPHGDIEAERRLLEDPVARIQPVGLLHPEEPVADGGVRVHRPLGPPGGPRRVDDVREPGAVHGDRGPVLALVFRGVPLRVQEHHRRVAPG